MTSKGNSKKTNLLVVGDASWADTIPQWILNEVSMERTINAAINLVGKKKFQDHEQVGDAEVIAYLMPATMKAPIDNDYVEIYIYLSAKLMLKAKRVKEEALPNDFKESLKNGLSEYRKSLLRELRCKIFRARGGKIKHPVFDALEEVFKESVKGGRRK
jgi:hypothetical protein